MTKTCGGCSTEKPLEGFHRSRNGLHGRQSRCKECVAAQRRAIARTVIVTEKFCSSCAQTLPIDQFQKNRSSRDGHQSYCGSCAYKAQQRYLERNAEVVALRRATKLLTPLDPAASKTCRVCGETKPLVDFHAHRGTADGRATWCKTCAHQNDWPRKLARYGLTPETYQALYASQNGCCAICGDSGTVDVVPQHVRATTGVSRLHIDHCHETGRVRGLLCTRCNAGIGQLKDSPDVLRAALRYLEGAMTA